MSVIRRVTPVAWCGVCRRHVLMPLITGRCPYCRTPHEQEPRP